MRIAKIEIKCVDIEDGKKSREFALSGESKSCLNKKGFSLLKQKESPCYRIE